MNETIRKCVWKLQAKLDLANELQSNEIALDVIESIQVEVDLLVKEVENYE